MKVLEKTDDDKYGVFIDIIFDIKSDPLHVTRKRKLQWSANDVFGNKIKIKMIIFLIY